jgi:hypothetical protein
MTAATSLSPWSEPAISDHEAARANAEAQQHANERRCAVLVVAGAAHDKADAVTLLEMLGLGMEEIRAARPMAVVPEDLTDPPKSKGRKTHAA